MDNNTISVLLCTRSQKKNICLQFCFRHTLIYHIILFFLLIYLLISCVRHLSCVKHVAENQYHLNTVILKFNKDLEFWQNKAWDTFYSGFLNRPHFIEKRKDVFLARWPPVVHAESKVILQLSRQFYYFHVIFVPSLVNRT